MSQTKKVHEVYKFGDELGWGGFSVVRKARRKDNKKKVAIKIINKEALGDSHQLQMLQREIENMRRLKHPNIIELLEVYDHDGHIYLVLELGEGGMLFDHIVARGQYSEKDAANIVRQILQGVSYMHNNGIAHRDLKPENLLAMDDNCDIVKISDFGLSKEFLGDNNLHTACGTPEYAAPEVVSAQGTYDHAVDIWSIGVITYILLCGYPPFYDPGEQQGKLFEQITAGRYEFPSGDWDGISAEAKDFIRNILVTDPQQRMTSKQCLQHSWLVNNAQKNVPAVPLRRLASFRDSLKNYNKERERVQRTMNTSNKTDEYNATFQASNHNKSSKK